MYEKLEECPSCKHPKLSNYRICKDFSVSGESFALVKCEKCKLIFTTPRPDEEHIGSFYKSENYISHTNNANNITNLIYKGVRNITLRQKLSLIKKYTDKTKLLDYGSGAGTFLKYMHTHGYAVEGFETDPDARQNIKDIIDCPVYNNLSSLKSEKEYDIITAWHVLEHVHQLNDTLKALRKSLKSNGYLFIAVPNIESYDAKHYQEYWAAYDVPRHLYHFNQESFGFLAEKCKLKVKHVHPMKFDAFYVSMLSEKYKTGQNRFLKALSIGLKSNKLAQTSGQYSSLIYVLTK